MGAEDASRTRVLSTIAKQGRNGRFTDLIFFGFVKFLGHVGIHSSYCHLLDSHV